MRDRRSEVPNYVLHSGNPGVLFGILGVDSENSIDTSSYRHIIDPAIYYVNDRMPILIKTHFGKIDFRIL